MGLLWLLGFLAFRCCLVSSVILWVVCPRVGVGFGCVAQATANGGDSRCHQ